MNDLFNTLYRGDHNPSFDIEKHSHKCYEIVYYLSGSGEVFIGDQRHYFVKNTFCITPPGVLHNEKYTEDTNLFFVLFNIGGYNINLQGGLYEDSENLLILKYFEKLQTEFKNRDENYQLKLDIIILDMLIEIGRLKSHSVKTNLNPIYIKRFIDENYNMKINVKKLADMTGYSYDRFRHLFKEQFNISVINYILDMRLQNAKHMLLNSSYSIMDIANQCGFASSSQFITLFKKKEGITPYQYRK